MSGPPADMRQLFRGPAKRLCTGLLGHRPRLPALTGHVGQSSQARGPHHGGQTLGVSTLSPPDLHSSWRSSPAVSTRPAPAEPAAAPISIAHELVSGALVRWSASTPGKPPPTAVLVHGVLGSRKNVASFAQRIVEAFPSWQVLIVDCRCHGESAAASLGKDPHTIGTAAADIMALLSRLRLFPQALIGHSMGGKVVMTMAQQFSARASTLPRPVQVWVLDALPGDVRAGSDSSRQDHPADLIAALQRLTLPLPTRSYLQDQLTGQGFSAPIARWASTNLRAINGDHRKLTWTFDLRGIDDLYQSYEATDMWRFLQQPAQGITVNFVRAERSVFKWAPSIVQQIQDLGHHVHLLPGAGHWVHTDNPEGLLGILAPSLGSARL